MTHHRAGELLTVTDECLTVQPDLGEFGNVLEPEGIELEGSPVVLPVLMYEDCFICRASGVHGSERGKQHFLDRSRSSLVQLDHFQLLTKQSKSTLPEPCD